MRRAVAAWRFPAQCRVGVAAILLGLAAGAAHASDLLTEIVGLDQTERDTLQTIILADDWTVTCESRGGKESCRMSTLASGNGSDGRILTVQLASEPGGESGERLFFFLTPLDLLVARGAEMRIDGGAPVKLGYRSCHPQGCVIPFRLSAALESSFRRGTKLALRLFGMDGGAVDVDLSLKGFVAAASAMETR